MIESAQAKLTYYYNVDDWLNMTSGLPGLLTKTLIFNLTPNLVFATLHPERLQSVWSDIFKEVRPVEGFPELYLFQVWPCSREAFLIPVLVLVQG